MIPLVPEGVEPFEPMDDDPHIIEEALDLLCHMAADPKFAHPGQRNDDGVNLCIALSVLGCKDKQAWLHAVDANGLHLEDEDYQAISEKLDIVDAYIPAWSHYGNDARNLLAYSLM